jgi:hypothetical protein
MSSDIQMILVVGSVHVVGLAFAAALLWHFMRASGEDGRPSDESEGGGGGNLPAEPPEPRRPRGGGLPLPDAVPARVRLRGPGRSPVTRPAAPSRRPSHAPLPARRRTPV